ncbi:hypothetical protein ACWDA7_01060 [Streptomyces sp. NPDC001156]
MTVTADYWDDFPEWCSRCQQEKPASEFAFEARRGLQPWCRKCKTEYTRELRRQRREGQEGHDFPPIGSGIGQAEWQELSEPERQRVREVYGIAD